MIWYFLFFLISGFCSILYELVWLRLAMAQYGVNTAVVSIVLSVFMAGLGLGSWLGGVVIRKYAQAIPIPTISVYGLTELLIGASAIFVPVELNLGHRLLEQMGSFSSHEYFAASGLWIALTLVPWCFFMGATIPVAMEAIRSSHAKEEKRSFSFLYLANVTGAVLGTFIPLWLIEIGGFHFTLKIGAILNATIAALAFILGTRSRRFRSQEVASAMSSPLPRRESRRLLWLLFLTGLTSMGMEVAWIREFTPYEGTVVYAFATILAVYLSATFIGSRAYRYWSRHGGQESAALWLFLGLAAVIAPVVANPNIHRGLSNLGRVVIGIAPFTGLLGLITPLLVDRWSAGDAVRAGRAYAVNVLGCILGPLLAGFLLLPRVGERWVILLLSLPWLIIGGRPAWSAHAVATGKLRFASYLLLPMALIAIANSKDYDQQRDFPLAYVRRDHTATVIARGQGMRKQLLVNGIGMTFLSPITKMMAHMPLAMLQRAPRNALVICFGMGTTYRAAISWDIPVTAVELVPSVPQLFWYFHSDANQILTSPRSHLVIDDGRRFLERTKEQYDVIIIDPPPPVDAAASGLLYSKEFYVEAKKHLRFGGIVQQWVPGGDAVDIASFARSFQESFPYVRVYPSIEGWGYHLFGSEQPLPEPSAGMLAAHMPTTAIKDLMEWGPKKDPEAEFATVVNGELPIEKLIAEAPGVAPITDDRPMNEYYILRRQLFPERWRSLVWRDHENGTAISGNQASLATPK